MSSFLKSAMDKLGNLFKVALVLICFLSSFVLFANGICATWQLSAEDGQSPFSWNLFFSSEWVVGSLVVLGFSLTGYLVLSYYREVVRAYDLEDKIQRDESASFGEYPQDIERIAQSELYDSMQDVEVYERAMASLFLTACITPQEVFTYIEDRVKTYTRSLGVKSKVIIHVPYNMKSFPSVFPVMFHSRGDFPESLEITDETGASITYLNISETQEHIRKVLTVCLNELGRNGRGEALLADLFRFVEFNGDISDRSVKDRTSQLKELMIRVQKLLPDTEQGRVRYRIVEQFLWLMIESFPICVRCVIGSDGMNWRDSSIGMQHFAMGEDERPVKDETDDLNQYPLARLVKTSHAISFVISRRIPLVQTKGFGPNFKGFYKKASKLFRRPNTFYYGLGNADRAQSYCLQTAGPSRTYCSLVELKRRELEDCEEMGFPHAKNALAQTRCGQRHFWLYVDGGRGFSNWYLMFRHTPRHFNAYHLSLVVMAMEAVALWVYGCMLLPLGGSQIPCRGDFANVQLNQNTAILSVFLGMLSVAAAWVSRSNNFGRGGEWATQASAVVTVLVAIAAVIGINMPINITSEPDFRFVLLTVTAVLCAWCSVLFAYVLAWIIVGSSFRKCSIASQNILADAVDSVSDNSRNVPPGWIAQDCNRFVCRRFDSDLMRAWQAEYREDRKYVRNAFVNGLIKIDAGDERDAQSQ